MDTCRAGPCLDGLGLGPSGGPAASIRENFFKTVFNTIDIPTLLLKSNRVACANQAARGFLGEGIVTDGTLDISRTLFGPNRLSSVSPDASEVTIVHTGNGPVGCRVRHTHHGSGELVCIAQTTTESANATALIAVEREIENTRVALQAAGAGLVTINSSGVMCKVSETMARIAQAPGGRKALVDQNVKCLMPRQLARYHNEYVKMYGHKVQSHGAPLRSITSRGLRLDSGAEYEVKLWVHAAEDRNRGEMMFQGVLQDVSVTMHKGHGDGAGDGLEVEDEVVVSHMYSQWSEFRSACILASSVGTIVYASPGAHRMFGYDVSLAGEYINILMTEPHRSRHGEYMRAFMVQSDGSGLKRTIHSAAVKRSGHEFPVCLSLHEVLIGESVYFLAVIDDATEAEKARIQKEYMDEQVREVWDGRNGALRVDDQGVIVAVNGQAEGMLRMSRTDLIGARIHDMLPSTQVLCQPNIAAAFLEGRQGRKRGNSVLFDSLTPESYQSVLLSRRSSRSTSISIGDPSLAGSPEKEEYVDRTRCPVMSGRGGTSSEVQIVCGDGRQLPFIIGVENICESAEGPFLITLRDLSETVNLEGERDLLVRQLGDVVTRSVHGVIIIDSSSVIQDANDQMAQIFGYRHVSELVGRNVTCLMTGSYANEHASHVRNCIQRGPDYDPRHQSQGLPAVRADGNSGNLHVSVRMMKFYLKGEVYFMGLINDVSAEVVQLRETDEAIERINAMMEATVSAVVITDDDMIIERFNSVAEKLFGYARGDMEGQNVSRMIPPPHSDEHDRHYRNFRTAGVSHIIGKRRTVPVLTASGEVMTCALLIHESMCGSRVKYVAVMDDITKRTADQKNMMNRERVLSQALELASNALVACDEDGVIVEFNRAAEEIFGWSKVEAVGKNVTLLMTPEDAVAHPSYISSYITQGFGSVFGQKKEREAVAKDGSILNVALMVSESTNDAGQRVFVGVMQDLTEQKARDLIMLHSQKQMRLTLDNGSQGMILADCEGVILQANPAVAIMFEWPSANDMIGRPVTELMRPGEAAEHPGFIKRYLKSGIKQSIDTVQDRVGLRKDGALIPIEISLSECDSNGETVFLASIRDVSKERNTAELADKAEIAAHAILDSAGVVVVAVDYQSVVVRVSGNSSALLAYEPFELVGNDIAAIIPKPHTHLHGDYVTEYVTTGNIKPGYLDRARLVRVRRKDGMLHEVEMTIVEMHVGSKVLFVAAIRDAEQTVMGLEKAAVGNIQTTILMRPSDEVLAQHASLPPPTPLRMHRSTGRLSAIDHSKSASLTPPVKSVTVSSSHSKRSLSPLNLGKAAGSLGLAGADGTVPQVPEKRSVLSKRSSFASTSAYQVADNTPIINRVEDVYYKARTTSVHNLRMRRETGDLFDDDYMGDAYSDRSQETLSERSLGLSDMTGLTGTSGGGRTVLDQMLSLAKALGSTCEVQHFPLEWLRLAVQLVACDVGVVYLWKPVEKRMVVHQCFRMATEELFWAKDEQTDMMVSYVTESRPIMPNKGVCKKVLEMQCSSSFTTAAAADLKDGRSSAFRDLQLKYVVACPMTVTPESGRRSKKGEKEVIGLVEMFSWGPTTPFGTKSTSRHLDRAVGYLTHAISRTRFNPVSYD